MKNQVLLVLYFLLSTELPLPIDAVVTLNGSTEACQGSIVTLQCMVLRGGSTLVDSQWLRNNIPILTNDDSDNYEYAMGSSVLLTEFIITNITMEDNNVEFRCQDPANSDDADSVVLSVTGPPSDITDVTVSSGCLSIIASWNSVTSNDEVCGLLSYDMTILPPSDVQPIKITNTSYNFTGLTPNNSYTITVAGRNNAGVGRSSSSMMTSVSGPPLIARLSEMERCVTDFTVSWDNDNSDPMQICGAVSYNVTISSSDGVVMKNITITDTSYNFTNLTENSNYAVTVAGINNGGQGEPSMTSVRTTTMTQAVPSVVTNIRSTRVKPNSVTIKWDMAVSSDFCGNEVPHYQLMISSDNSPITVYSLEHTFRNLRSNTTYTITVAAVNRAGIRMSDTFTISTTISPGPRKECFDKTWCIIVVVLCCILGCSCIISCTSSSFIFICLRREEDSTITINIFMVTIGILSFGTAIPVWYIYDNCIRNKEGKDSSKDKRCFNILTIGSCGFVYILNLLFDRPSKIKDRDAPDSQNMPLQHKDTNKPVRSAAEEQALYSYARTGPINVVMEGGSSTRPGDKPRQT